VPLPEVFPNIFFCKNSVLDRFFRNPPVPVF
jgi:hypothetical protein